MLIPAWGMACGAVRRRFIEWLFSEKERAATRTPRAVLNLARDLPIVK